MNLCPVQEVQLATQWTVTRIFYQAYSLSWGEAVPTVAVLALDSLIELYEQYQVVPERVLRYCENHQLQYSLPLEAA